MATEVRPIDANALAKKIREYMADYPNATTRLAACRAILSMLGDEGQTPTLPFEKCDQNAIEIRPGFNLVANEPLTMEQLRKMDGQPVWVRVSENWRKSGIYEGWMLIRFHENDDRIRAYTYDTRFGATFHAQQDYGISWWAYAYPPVYIDWEAVESTWERGKYPSGTHYLFCKKCGERNSKMSKFCPSCGRAMTPEARIELKKALSGFQNGELRYGLQARKIGELY